MMELGALNKYRVELKNMMTETCEYRFQLDDNFFLELDSPEIQKGQLDVVLKVKKTSGVYQLDFQTVGMVVVTCDRCLDEMEQPIDTVDSLKVKLGEEFAEIDDLIVVPEVDGYINVAWFMFEFIALNVPMKHVHADGKCNSDMIHKLNEHLRVEEDEADCQLSNDDADSQNVDPRWNELKKILDNN